MADDDAIRWSDETGRVRWQPAVGDRSLCRDMFAGGRLMLGYEGAQLKPVLYRSRRRAVWVSRRWRRRLARRFRRGTS